MASLVSVGSLLSVMFNGFVDLYREWIHRRDVEDLAARRYADELRARYAAEFHRLGGMGHEELALEVEREIGPDGVAAGRALLERLRRGA